MSSEKATDNGANNGKRYFGIMGAAIGTLATFVVVGILFFADKSTVAAMGAEQVAIKAEQTAMKEDSIRQSTAVQSDLCEIKTDIKTLLIKVSALEAKLP